MTSTLAQFPLLEGLMVSRIIRPDSNAPLFAVREFDTKILRCPPTNTNSLVKNRRGKKNKLNGSSEQAIRVQIRSAILRLGLDPIPANKSEIKILKESGILGKRAPSCSLLCGKDMVALLDCFGQDIIADALRNVCATNSWLAVRPNNGVYTAPPPLPKAVVQQRKAGRSSAPPPPPPPMMYRNKTSQAPLPASSFPPAPSVNNFAPSSPSSIPGLEQYLPDSSDDDMMDEVNDESDCESDDSDSVLPGEPRLRRLEALRPAHLSPVYSPLHSLGNDRTFSSFLAEEEAQYSPQVTSNIHAASADAMKSVPTVNWCPSPIHEEPSSPLPPSLFDGFNFSLADSIADKKRSYEHDASASSPRPLKRARSPVMSCQDVDINKVFVPPTSLLSLSNLNADIPSTVTTTFDFLSRETLVF